MRRSDAIDDKTNIKMSSFHTVVLITIVFKLSFVECAMFCD